MYNATLNSELRGVARQQLKGNWLGPILALILYTVIVSAITSIPIAGIIFCLLIVGPFTLGITIYFLKFVRGQQPRIEEIFNGFKLFGESLGLYLLMALFVLLWTLLLIIPGIIMSFAYSQAFFILADNPNMKTTDILRTSNAMMKGYKMKYFLLGLSFIGWSILCVLTIGIGFLWLSPYIKVSFTNFYEDVKNAYISNQQQEA